MEAAELCDGVDEGEEPEGVELADLLGLGEKKYQNKELMT